MHYPGRKLIIGTALAAASLVAVAQTVPIAGLVELSGTGATAGTNFDNGVKLAVKEINAAGGLAGNKIAYSSYDTQTNPGVAKALAYPPTAAEWCLPLVHEGGSVVLWVGPSAEPERVAAAAAQVAGELESSPPGFLVLRKTGPTPEGFPRRAGVAKKRPLA